jgi:hypothetical protein
VTKADPGAVLLANETDNQLGTLFLVQYQGHVKNAGFPRDLRGNLQESCVEVRFVG